MMNWVERSVVFSQDNEDQVSREDGIRFAAECIDRCAHYAEARESLVLKTTPLRTTSGIILNSLR